MRSANLVITGGIAAFTTFLALYTSPVGTRELHHWAMILGMFTSTACISWLFFAAIISSKRNNPKGQLLILLGYASALALCAISGGLWRFVFYNACRKSRLHNRFQIYRHSHTRRLHNSRRNIWRGTFLSKKTKITTAKRITTGSNRSLRSLGRAKARPLA